MITQEELKEILEYSKSTGIFTWKKHTNPATHARIVGKVAGNLNKSSGYIQIRVKGRLYYAHILAWLYEYGVYPKNKLDHKDRIKSHNWIENLREASQQQNSCNTNINKNNTSGAKGVYWHKAAQKWMVSVMYNGKANYAGLFSDKEEAISVASNLRIKLHKEFATDGEIV